MRKIAGLMMTLLLGLGSVAHATNYSFFYGIGEAISLHGTVRIGINEWEFGKLSPSTIGVVKRFERNSVYAAFGPILHLSSTGMGLSTAIGWQPVLIGGLRFRTEAIAYGAHTGVVKGEALLGLSYTF